mmetsp:Transcript_24639/g.75115  ORF Transcript_24639/g.75115 Transcript_24639/m.75115 type:complete len:601 (-) Transcript_24639:230-2032(-)
MRVRPVLRALGRARLPAEDRQVLRALIRQAIRTPLDDGDPPPPLCASVQRAYSRLSADGQRSFLTLLAEHLDVDDQAVVGAASMLVMSHTDDARIQAHDAMRHALTPLHESVFHAISRQPGGLPFLISLRSDVLKALAEGRRRSGGLLDGRQMLSSSTMVEQGAASTTELPPSRLYSERTTHLTSLNASLIRLLSNVFDKGNLDLMHITWNGSPAAVLDKLIRNERVHAMKGWDDLRARLGHRRHVFALCHPRMPLEPLVFVQVALCDRIPNRLVDVMPHRHDLVETELRIGEQGEDEKTSFSVANPNTNESTPCVAVFYSISAPFDGLRGVPLGRELLGRVLGQLQRNEPSLTAFVTLSPVPGFSRWLRERWEQRAESLMGGSKWTEEGSQCGTAKRPNYHEGNEDERREQQLLDSLESALHNAQLPFDALFTTTLLKTVADSITTAPVPPRGQCLKTEPPHDKEKSSTSYSIAPWSLGQGPNIESLSSTRGPMVGDPAGIELRGWLMVIVVHYLLRTHGRARDPVANFHLRNGAQLAHIHWGANCANYALAQSSGIMVSYQYEPTALLANRKEYLETGRVRASPEVVRMLDGAHLSGR